MGRERAGPISLSNRICNGWGLAVGERRSRPGSADGQGVEVLIPPPSDVGIGRWEDIASVISGQHPPLPQND